MAPKRNLNKLLSKAIRIASEAHEKILDKGGKPYILHPMRLMFRLRTDDAELMMVAILHDVVEDSDWTIDDLRKEGFTERVLEALDLMTHKDDLEYMEYIDAMSENYDAIVCKMEDLRDNSDITRLKGVSEKDIERMRKYHEAFLRLQQAKNDFHC